MDQEGITLDDIYRVLIQIRDLLEEKKTTAKKNLDEISIQKENRSGSDISHLIRIYIETWQKRYQTKARPEITKAMGIFKRLRRDYSLLQLSDYLQVYCGMDDKWFCEKRHDVVTFGENIGKVALAADKGINSTDVNWDRVFGGDDGQTTLSEGSGTHETNLGRKELPRGETYDLLENLPDDE